MFNYKKRINKLVSLLESNNIKAALVTDKTDLLYYTGYKVSDTAFLVVDTKTHPKLLLSPLDNEAEKLDLDVSFVSKKNDLNFLKKYKQIIFDENDLSARRFKFVKKLVKLKEGSKIMKQPRTVKEPKEIELVRMAVKITKDAQKDLEFVGKTEKQVASHIDIKFREQRADNAFDTIVASGENGFFIHHTPSEKKINKGELVILDSGAKHKDYCADLTRTFSSNLNKSSKLVLEDVKEMQGKIIDFLEPGKTFKEIQKFYEKLMQKKKYKVMHSFGHGIGLSVHESVETLEKNTLVTVEPGVYLKPGGCRIEDIILIKDKPRVL